MDLRRFRLSANSERGATMFEYALIVSLIAVIAITAVAVVGIRVEETFVEVGERVAGVIIPGEDRGDKDGFPGG